MTTAPHTPMLTDAGLETWLVFQEGIDLPAFAAFPLLDDEAGRATLERYLHPFFDTARRTGLGFVLETPTWRANPQWAATVGYDLEATARVNRDAVAAARAVAARHADVTVRVSGCIGPRGDGYQADHTMAPDEAAEYHDFQVGVLAEAGVDQVSALTLTTVSEAAGVATAAARHGVPVVIGFTVETDGTLACGLTLGDAIEATDAATGGYPLHYMVNCAHPSHIAGSVDGGRWQHRVGAIRPNASTLSHAELDVATELDDGDPVELAAGLWALADAFTNLAVVGGCCGTDHRHVDAMASAWAHRSGTR